MTRTGLATAALISSMIALSSPTQAQVCGSEIFQYKDVPALSNGSFQRKGDTCGGYGTYGWEFQCVEYVRRFYSLALGVDTDKSNGWGGDAKDYFYTANEKGLLRFVNGASPVPPKPNDIVVFGPSKKNQYGHVAIVTEVVSGEVRLIEQNWSDNGQATVYVRQDPKSGFWAIGPRESLPVLGWLRLPPTVPDTFWIPTTDFLVAARAVVQALSVDNDEVLYATTNRGCFDQQALGIFRSTDEGDTWSPLSVGLVSTNVRAVVTSPANDVYAGAHDGVYRLSSDRHSWEATSLRGVDISVMLATGNAVYAGDGCFCSGIHKSTDRGHTWQTINSGLAPCVNGLAANSEGDLFAGTGTGGVYRLASGESTWRTFNAGLSNSNVSWLDIGTDDTLYASTVGGGVFKRPASSASWEAINNGLTNYRVETVGVAPSGTLFAGTQGSGVFMAENSGNTWQTANDGIIDVPATPGIFAFSSGGRAFTATGGRVYRSRDHFPPTSTTTLLIDFEAFPGLDGILGTVDDIPTPTYPELTPCLSLSSEFSSVGVDFSSGTLFQGAFFPGTSSGNHFVSSEPLDVTFSSSVHSVSVQSFSTWTAVAYALDSSGNILATDVLVHPTPGTGTFFLGTLVVSSAQPIARFLVHPEGCGIDDSCSEILNLDNLIVEK